MLLVLYSRGSPTLIIRYSTDVEWKKKGWNQKKKYGTQSGDWMWAGRRVLTLIESFIIRCSWTLIYSLDAVAASNQLQYLMNSTGIRFLLFPLYFCFNLFIFLQQFLFFHFLIILGNESALSAPSKLIRHATPNAPLHVYLLCLDVDLDRLYRYWDDPFSIKMANVFFSVMSCQVGQRPVDDVERCRTLNSIRPIR